ncbi:hypothetical protein QJS10_CPB22g00405 [Acorus calamus]|uniref:Uncharacterized protein n=1 Tax=Acorus calamus TaxID=4465 RepID=A0AAV9C215_ACOCL|nr:hypothetical protein QJS10_CPB22g00405 [Acorus calamus]
MPRYAPSYTSAASSASSPIASPWAWRPTGYRGCGIDSLGRAGVKDSGLLARKNRTGGHSKGEIVVWGPDSLGYARTPMELLRIFNWTGYKSRPGGFFPVGVRGTIGQALLSGSDVNTTCPL